MWPKTARVIKKLTITDTDMVKNDPDILRFIETAPQRLGKKGRFVVRLSGIPEENRVLVEGKSKRLCNRCLAAFEKLLIRKGCVAHEHVWEVLRETDYGEMDYHSSGGGVEHFVVTLYVCPLCGLLRKAYRGDFCGNPEEYLEITADDIALSEQVDL